MDYIQKYTEDGLDLVIAAGGTDYEKAKHPIHDWKTDAPSVARAQQAFAAGRWIGIVVPPGAFCLDIDHAESLAGVQPRVQELVTAGCGVSRTKNGIHVYGRLPPGSDPARGSQSVTASGVHVTARPGGKTYCLEAPTPDREWIHYPDWADLGVLPDWLLPVCSTTEYKKITESKTDMVTKIKKTTRKRTGADVAENLLEAAVAAIRSAVKGERQITINRASYLAGGLVGALDREQIKRQLLDAALSVVDDETQDTVEKWVEHGLTDGERSPLDLSDRRAVRAAGVELRRQTSPLGARVVYLAQTVDTGRTPQEEAQDVFDILSENFVFFVYNGTLWAYDKQTDESRAVVRTRSQAVAELQSLCAPFFRFASLETGRVLTGSESKAALLTLYKKLTQDEPVTPRYVGAPAIVDGTLYTKTDVEKKIFIQKRAGGQLATCSPAESYRAIMDAIQTWEFEEPETGPYQVLAALCGLALKADYMFPAVIIDGHQPGVGKTELARFIAQATCDEGQFVQTTVGGGDPEELRKRITAQIVSAPRDCLILDNVKTTLQGDYLESLLTGNKITDRLLGSSEVVEIQNNFLTIATMNNATLSEDMLRRVLVIRLLPPRRAVSGFPRVVRDLAESVRPHVLNLLMTFFKEKVNVPLIHTGGTFDDALNVVSGIIAWCEGKTVKLLERWGEGHRELSARAQSEYGLFTIMLGKFGINREFTGAQFAGFLVEEIAFGDIGEGINIEAIIPNYSRYARDAADGKPYAKKAIQVAAGIFLSRRMAMREYVVDGQKYRITRATGGPKKSQTVYMIAHIHTPAPGTLQAAAPAPQCVQQASEYPDTTPTPTSAPESPTASQSGTQDPPPRFRVFDPVTIDEFAAKMSYSLDEAQETLSRLCKIGMWEEVGDGVFQKLR